MPISNPPSVFIPRSAVVDDVGYEAATGTGFNPEYINDKSLATSVATNIIGEYAEIAFNETLFISQYRLHSYDAAHNEDGRWKIQYWDIPTEAWVDWKTGIPTTIVNDWGPWDTSPGRVKTNKLRLVCTIVDTGVTSAAQQIEVKD